MARFAPVVPLSIAGELQTGKSHDYLGGYHLLLAHDILDKPERYQYIYGRVRESHLDSFIIMDNSIIELGKPMGITDLMAASRVLEPNCLVIPDVMGDGAATRESAIKFVREYSQAAYKAVDNMIDPPPLMGVLQGENVDDVMETLATFYALPLVEYIGIPRILTKMHGSRMPTLVAMQRSPALISTKYRSFKGFHLLGFSDDVLDDVSCARVPWIQGIDSAVPIRAGLKGIKISLDDPTWSDRTGPRGDFWEQSIEIPNQDTTVRYNLDTYRSWIYVRKNVIRQTA